MSWRELLARAVGALVAAVVMGYLLFVGWRLSSEQARCTAEGGVYRTSPFPAGCRHPQR